MTSSLNSIIMVIHGSMEQNVEVEIFYKIGKNLSSAMLLTLKKREEELY